MEDYITKTELTATKKISNSSLGLYLQKGLIPYPKLESNYKGKRGRTALYDRSVVKRIDEIKKLIKEGFRLNEIKKKLKIDDNYKEKNKIRKEAIKVITDCLETNQVLSKSQIDQLTHSIQSTWGTSAWFDEAHVISFGRLVKKWEKNKE